MRTDVIKAILLIVIVFVTAIASSMTSIWIKNNTDYGKKHRETVTAISSIASGVIAFTASLLLNYL